MKKILSTLIILSIISLGAIAQNFTLNFIGHGHSETVDSVFVTNLKTGNSIALSGNETLELVPGAGLRFLADTKNTNVAIYPNPSDNLCNIEFALEKEGKTSISLYDVAGKTLLTWVGDLSKSVHVFQLQGLTSGIYNIIIKSESLIYSNRIFGTGNGSNALSFSKISEYPAEEIQTTMINKSKSSNTLPYIYGELLLLEAISSEGHKTVKTLILNEVAQEQANRYIDFYFVDCIDADSYMYKTVEIGDYVWMAEDLKTTKYRDNSEIKNVKDTEEWIQLKEGAWCNYENESKEPVLYNWYSTSDVRQICPSGWHIPSDDEWKVLEVEIGMRENYVEEVGWRGNDLSWKLKEAGEEFWLKNDDEKTNLTGFSARANGMRNFAGNFYYKNNNAVWWTATESNQEYAWSRGIQYDVHSIFREDGRKNMGFSLRCIKNYPPILETKPVSEITENSAKSGGEVLNFGGDEIIAVGLIWGTNPEIDIEHNQGYTESTNIEDSSFSAKITGLMGQTKYYMCAYATNNAGTGYGEIISFTTLEDDSNTVIDIDGNVYD
ncbi:MAG: T9SS type A sorting domain-containing protein, partial [Bacteroidales bacterium]|nr:T9SS type A sorting domain-containing protein [Bacteroidales bacterium]